ncbi:hypothetical protein GCM10010346_30020 [Streptomyces chryseus]|uniref:Uncharacterized protein n=1 Tax=Streptomyces chryseus TaxID=68186 RepID=A0ABQ3DLZ8_9ACTN|nr:hypothetical protein GCM10010346_30020 [Streptomyces chryseus]
MASGVRSSWEAFAANLCCSATWDSSWFQHGVERVGEVTELVLAALHADPVGQRSVPGHPCRIRDLCEWCEHPAGEDPSPDEAEHEQGDLRLGRGEGERAHKEVAVGRDLEKALGGVRYVAQQKHPHHGQQESADNGEEPGVAEGEFQAGAEPWASTHA